MWSHFASAAYHFVLLLKNMWSYTTSNYILWSYNRSTYRHVIISCDLTYNQYITKSLWLWIIYYIVSSDVAHILFRLYDHTLFYIYLKWFPMNPLSYKCHLITNYIWHHLNILLRDLLSYTSQCNILCENHMTLVFYRRIIYRFGNLDK